MRAANVNFGHDLLLHNLLILQMTLLAILWELGKVLNWFHKWDVEET